jgi:hypothetical protein
LLVKGISKPKLTPKKGILCKLNLEPRLMIGLGLFNILSQEPMLFVVVFISKNVGLNMSNASLNFGI